MRSRSWSRRRVLRGAAGALLALPFLEFDGGRPAEARTVPKRLVIVFSPNGVPQAAWPPLGAPPSFTLGPLLGPLLAHQSSLVILQGVDMESSYHGPGDGMHLNGMGHMLTGTELVDTGFGTYWGGGISVDQLIAQHVGGKTKLASLELCVEDNPATVRSRMSYLGKAQPVPPEPDPRQTFARLFGAASPERTAQRKSVLDAVDADLAALSPRLGAADRAKVDAHLAAVRSLEARLAIPAACAPPALPELALPGAFDFPLAGRLQMDLLVRALACDLTRVATLQWSASTSNVVFSWLGITEPHHALSHAVPADAAAQLKLLEIDRWYAHQLAYLLDALSAIPEGDGTLLDHTLVLWCNELADGEIHSRRGMPYVLAGGAGGALTTGRWLKYGGAMAGATHNNLLVSICQAMDVDVSTFGNPAYCTGPLAGLLT